MAKYQPTIRLLELLRAVGNVHIWTTFYFDQMFQTSPLPIMAQKNIVQPQRITMPKQHTSLKSSCLEAVVTGGQLSSLVPSPLPWLPHPLDKELKLITVTGPGPVKLTRIEWTFPQVPRSDCQEFSRFINNIDNENGYCDHIGAESWRTGCDATPSGIAEVWRSEPGTWRFLDRSWRLGRCEDDGSHLYGIIKNSSIVKHIPAMNFASALKFYKRHIVTEQIQLGDPLQSYTEKAVYDKIEAIELPEEELPEQDNWTDEDWFEFFEKVHEEEELMVKEDRAVEEGWDALPFAPELQPLACGFFLASSVEYSWSGYYPGGLHDDDDDEDFMKVHKVLQISKEGKTWNLLVPAHGHNLLSGEGDSVLSDDQDGHRDSMRVLPTGQLLLIRKDLIPGLFYGGPDFRGASYTLYSPAQWFRLVPSTRFGLILRGKKVPTEGTFFFVRATAKTKIVLKHILHNNDDRRCPR